MCGESNVHNDAGDPARPSCLSGIPNKPIQYWEQCRNTSRLVPVYQILYPVFVLDRAGVPKRVPCSLRRMSCCQFLHPETAHLIRVSSAAAWQNPGNFLLFRYHLVYIPWTLLHRAGRPSHNLRPASCLFGY